MLHSRIPRRAFISTIYFIIPIALPCNTPPGHHNKVSSFWGDYLLFPTAAALAWCDRINDERNVRDVLCVLRCYGGYGDGVAIAKAKKGFGGVRCWTRTHTHSNNRPAGWRVLEISANPDRSHRNSKEITHTYTLLPYIASPVPRGVKM